mmetsp:Transcript_10156/g.20809  ORF Transcript_10156/g.20809 Transcript_10156/m.20809 type:complete len:1005 (-) Transcript_10156:4-3018(-)
MDVEKLRSAVLSEFNAQHTRNNSAGDAGGFSTALLDELRQQSDGFLYCLRLLSSTDQGGGKGNVAQHETHVVEFFALSTIAHFLNTGMVSSFEHRRMIREVTLSLGVARNVGVPRPQFVTAKIAHVVAILVKKDYPESWAGAFEELLSFSMSHPELFLRILGALVDEVVDFSADLSREDVQRNSLIKDSMRGISPSNPSAPAPETTVMPRIFSSMVEIIRLASTCNVQNSDCSSSSAALAVLSFSTMKLYVSWVDINLIMHENVINAIFGSLTSQRSDGVAEAAADCVLEIVNKGMDELMKLQLLQQLNLFEILSSMSSSSVALETKLGEIVNAVGVQLLALFDNQPGAAAVFLQQWMQLTVKVLCHNSIEVSSQVIPCLSRFTMSLGKQQSKGPAGDANNPADLKAFLPTFLSCLYRQMQYPEGYVFDTAEPSSLSSYHRTSSNPALMTGAGEAEEDEDEEETYRNELRKMYSKIVRWHPDSTLMFVGMAFSNLPTPLSTASFPPCEAALRLLFHFQEGLSSKSSKLIGSGGMFDQIVLALFESDVDKHQHYELVILYLDICVRYGKVLIGLKDVAKRDVLIGRIFECIGRSMEGGGERIRSRLCYLMLRFVKALGRGGLSSNVADCALQMVLGIINVNTQAKYSLINVDDQNYIFECAGILNSKCSVGGGGNLSLFISPLLMKMQEVMGGQGEKVEKGAFIAVLVAGIASLSKGLVKDEVGAEGKELFLQALQGSIQALQLLGEEECVRSRGMVLIHRMVLLLGDDVLPYVGSFLGPLVANCDNDVVEVVQLMNQLLIRFGCKVAGSLENIIIPFMNRCQSLVPVDGSASQINVEAVSIRKIQILFLQHVVSNGCGAVFLSPKVGPGITGILELLCNGMEIKEGSRSCVVFFCKICEGVEEWSGGDRAKLEAFWEFVFNKVLVTLWRVMMGKNFNVKDAQCLRTLNEASVLMRIVRIKRGERFMGFVDALSGFVGDLKGGVVGMMKTCEEGEMKDIIKSALT